jgi:TolB protein
MRSTGERNSHKVEFRDLFQSWLNCHRSWKNSRIQEKYLCLLALYPVKFCTDRKSTERIIMRPRTINLGMAFLALTLLIEGAMVSGESHALQDHWGAAVYENIVVWIYKIDGSEDIYGYNLTTKQMFQVTTHKGDQEYPAIYKDTVVWMDYRDGNYDIYGYNLTTGQELPVIIADGDQMDPAIYDDIVVWQDNRNGNWDIYGAHLLTNQEFPIITEPSDQSAPAIYEDTVVYADNVSGSWDIYAYNMLTGERIQVTAAPGDQIVPEIFQDFIVWADNRNGNWDIYGYNLAASEEIPIVTDSGSQMLGGIYGDIVVWADDRNGDFDIYGYNLVEREEFCLVTNPSDQLFPAIYGDTVIWTDTRNGNWDLYGSWLSGGEEFRITGEDQQAHKGETEDYEAEYLILEAYHLEGATLTVCFQNKLDTETIVNSEYKNDSLITSQLQETLQGNTRTCFSLRGAYTIEDKVTLITEKGTILSFTVNPEEVEIPSEMDVYTTLLFLIPLLLGTIIIVLVILRKKNG